MARFTWPLIPDPTAAPAGSGAVAVATSSPIDSIFGFGLTRPFKRDSKNDFATNGGSQLIKSSVGQILGTRAQGGQVQGEIPWRPDFGSRMYLLRQRKGAGQEELARVYAQESLRRWEPRVNVTAVKTEFDRESRVRTVHVKFDVIDRNKPGNNVLLKGLETTVPVG